jgi:hypothetical protein
MGIPGIKYADAGSRGQGGSGTRNFVVFPGEEKNVRILERDGQKAPPQKIAQALEAAPDYRMNHRPLKVENGAAQLNKAYEVFGQDIYGPNALQYFGGRIAQQGNRRGSGSNSPSCGRQRPSS